VVDEPFLEGSVVGEWRVNLVITPDSISVEAGSSGMICHGGSKTSAASPGPVREFSSHDE
jgi:hypothetical protein